MKNLLHLFWFCAGFTTPLLAEALPHVHVTTNIVSIDTALINLLVAEARTNNPALQAAGSRADAAALNVASVRVWEDPTARFGTAVPSPRGFKTSEEGNLIYGFDQKLPLFKKPEFARRVMEAEALKEQRQVDFQTQQLRRDVAQSLYHTALSDRVVEINRQDLAWIETMVQTVEQRYAVNQASQVDVLRLQAERSKRIAQLRTEEKMREHGRVSLNRLLNRELHTSWPGLELPSIAPAVVYSHELLSLALGAEPKLKVIQAEIDQAGAVAKQTRRSRWPDVSVGAETRQYAADGGFREGTFTVSLSLPWANGDKYRNDQLRDETRVRAAQFDLTSQQKAVQEDIHHQTVEIDAARREALLYRDEMIPRSEQALAAALVAWENNRGMLQDVLEARRMVLDSRLMYARAVAEQHATIAGLLLNCGLTDAAGLPKDSAERTDKP